MKIERILENLNGAKIVSLRTKTAVKTKATAKMAFPKGVTKIATRNGIIGADYENVVNGRLEKQGEVPDFDAQSLWNGKGRAIDRHIVEHAETGKRYLKFLPNQDRTHSIYIDNATGLEIDFEAIKPYMPAFREPTNQGTEKPVFWQTIELDNILSLTSGEIVYNK